MVRRCLVRSVSESTRLQKFLFRQGYRWTYSGNNLFYPDQEKYVIVIRGEYLHWDANISYSTIHPIFAKKYYGFKLEELE